MEAQKSVTARIVFGLALIVIGILYLLENLNLIPGELGDIIISFPSLVLLVGLVSLYNSKNKLFGSIVTIIGVLLMLPKIIPGININGDIIFPLIVIIFGGYLVLRSKTNNENPGENNSAKYFKGENKDRIEDVAIFGGGEKIIHSDNFQGGSITAIFGGTEIDLSQCKLAPGDHVLDVVAVFGGMEITVPANWRVQVDVFPLFGGFSNKYKRNPSLVVDQQSTLYIKGIVIFGGGELKIS